MTKELDLFNEAGANIGAKLDVAIFSFIGQDNLSWREIFSGYDKLRAITYSSGINFIYQLHPLFKEVEIVFGCEDVISGRVEEIFAYQGKLMERIRKNEASAKDKLIDRIENQTVKLFVSRDAASHEKIYLLEASDGRKRVVMGSANMSHSAFGGRQRENIAIIDDESAFEYYKARYETLRDISSDSISNKAIQLGDVGMNIGEIPIMEAVKVKKAIVIEPSREVNEGVKFAFSVNEAAKNIKQFIPRPEKSGRTLLQVDSVKVLKSKVVANVEMKHDLEMKKPQLVVDVDGQEVTFNDNPLSLTPSVDEIANDVGLFVQYMKGFDSFYGDKEDLKNRYFEFANWFFCSPFMASMRKAAASYGKTHYLYPVFGLLYGQSKAGKTSYLETLLKMMIGQKPTVSAGDFTRTYIDELRRTIRGTPIIIDDMTQTRFSVHAIETIKNDNFGVLEGYKEYPAIVISANEDVKAVAQEITRRTIICRVNAGLTNLQIMKGNVVHQIQKKMGTAFYREYLRRMLVATSELIELMKDDESEAPDILAVSSKILCDIIREHVDDVPAYVRELSIENYFGSRVTAKLAIETICDAWKYNPKAFTVNKRRNQLTYESPDHFEIGRLKKELPENLEAKSSGSLLILKLDEARKFFACGFERSLFSRIFK